MNSLPTDYQGAPSDAYNSVLARSQGRPVISGDLTYGFHQISPVSPGGINPYRYNNTAYMVNTRYNLGTEVGGYSYHDESPYQYHAPPPFLDQYSLAKTTWNGYNKQYGHYEFADHDPHFHHQWTLTSSHQDPRISPTGGPKPYLMNSIAVTGHASDAAALSDRILPYPATTRANTNDSYVRLDSMDHPNDAPANPSLSGLLGPATKTMHALSMSDKEAILTTSPSYLTTSIPTHDPGDTDIENSGSINLSFDPAQNEGSAWVYATNTIPPSKYHHHKTPAQTGPPPKQPRKVSKLSLAQIHNLPYPAALESQAKILIYPQSVEITPNDNSAEVGE